jgi:hypothetical protein
MFGESYRRAMLVEGYTSNTFDYSKKGGFGVTSGDSLDEL